MKPHAANLRFVGAARYTPPASSYWADPSITRDQLKALIAARRGQQRSPTEAEMRWDPLLSATAALEQDHKRREATR